MQRDDLRYVLAVHRTGTLAGAARLLGVSHVTVFRRIEAIEKTLGARLFDRKRQGYIATPAAAEIVQQAAQIEEQIKAMESRVWKHDSRIHGIVRITSTDTFSALILAPLLAQLRQQCPEIVVDLVIVNGLLNIGKREADIAVRATHSPPEMLVGHRIGPLRFAVYASKSFAARHLRKDKDLSKVPWVRLDASLSGDRSMQWIGESGYQPRIALFCNSYLGRTYAVHTGVGVGVMSCIVAAGLPGLVRVSPLIPELETQVWILVHPDLREVARVAAVYAFLRTELGKLRARFAGEE
ncbi:MAG: LysR family transcriptional regulator [Gammaproteobacteria bacterium]|nr:LysR family transcriptional regulator [Gammaproteobacteria bacterium]